MTVELQARPASIADNAAYWRAIGLCGRDKKETDVKPEVEFVSTHLKTRTRQVYIKTLERADVMDDTKQKSIVVFDRPFTVAGFDETLPPGEYEIETELAAPPDHLYPEAWMASVQVKLHPKPSQPGLARTLTVSLVDLDLARAKDKLTGKPLSDVYLEAMLADPMVKLVMEADGFSETQLRHLYSGFRASESDVEILNSVETSQRGRYNEAIQIAENEGLPPRSTALPTLNSPHENSQT